MLGRIVNFLRSLREIERSPTNIVILACPILLLFMLLTVLISINDEQPGSVVANSRVCAKIGSDALKDGGSVVDAAIATMFCEGVWLPNRAGIGGGFTAVLYAMDGMVRTMIATPVVPKYFQHEYQMEYKETEETLDAALAAGVPAELMGYWEMHKKYGLVPWKKLIEPTIAICEKGISTTEWLEYEWKRAPSNLYRTVEMRKLYTTMLQNQEGQNFKLKVLAKTLRSIAQHGPNVFYRGEIGKQLIEDLQAAGGIMTMDDLKSLNVSFAEPVIFRLPVKNRVYTTGLPSMGAVVAMTLNILKKYKKNLKGTPVFWHRTIEAMKHAFGRSFSLADVDKNATKFRETEAWGTFENMTRRSYAAYVRDFIKDDRIFYDPRYYGVKHLPTKQAGTSNICIISPAGEAIVLTSSLMWNSGSFFYSKRTGIILNTQLRGFAVVNAKHFQPFRPAQIVVAGKRAISPHAPAIVLNRETNMVTFVVGASGGALIPSQVITALIYNNLLEKNASTAANSGYFYPDPYSNAVLVTNPAGDETFSKEILDYLRKVGHNLSFNHNENPYAIRNCIAHGRVKPDIQYHVHEQGGVQNIEPKNSFTSFLIITVVGVSLWIVSWLVYEIVTFENAIDGDSDVDDVSDVLESG